MKLQDLRSAYDTYSSKLSEVTRQLNFAGVAIIWIFKVGTESGGIEYSPFLLRPLCVFVISLGCDLLQYLYGSIAWSVYHRWKEIKGVDNNTDFKAPRAINWPSISFFYAKAILTILGYVLLLVYIASQLSHV